MTEKNTEHDDVGDTLLPDVLPPYGKIVRVWKKLASATQDTCVGDVGLSKTYAIVLDAPAGEPDRFVWVQEGILKSLMAHQPLLQANVFDARGRYLGTGGQPLDRRILRPVPLMESIPTRRASEPPRPATPEMVPYVFPLRRNLSVKLELPADFTAQEAERFARFLRSLPTEEL